MSQKTITFEEWWEVWKRSQDLPDDLVWTEHVARAAFNAGRTEARPRVWRWKREDGHWKVEFLEIPQPQEKINGHGEMDETTAE